ncbi:hypothetical protein J2X57_000077 [Luteibacter sp. 1214]|uniref:hypothetical protein n=1 Tax=Luteibacter sp. 1214 TaxID=2817735 RepID=UPI00285E2688|nr:hypothetical protein [Luteibacter sp. 1214]MDR6640883.1 hypothetical protein [Luteibacter sp. 1214]
MLFGSPPNSDELMAFKALLDAGLANVDSFNKVYVAALSGGVAFVSLVVGAVIQVFVMRRQLKVQSDIAQDQLATAARQLEAHEKIAEKQQESSIRQLDIQLSASRRLAHDNIAAKRQEWINGLRSDLSVYLAMWQDISYRWQAIVDRASEEINSQRRAKGGTSVAAKLPRFEKEVADIRFRAHENVLRIRLRLNPNEDNHNQLVKLIQRLEANVQQFDRTRSKEPTSVIQSRIGEIIEQILSQAQIILKEEWIRVKGEQGIVSNALTNAST